MDKIIVVTDIDAQHLAAWVERLRAKFPGASVLGFGDPMRAAQYGFNHPVDALYAVERMPRISGEDVARLVRHGNPGVEVFLLPK